MIDLRAVAFLALSLSACATLPPTPATPYLPAGVYGMYLDNDTGAIDQSSWAFASPGNTRNNPVAAAKAVVALEYLSGELRQNPRWIGMDLSTKLHMAQARDNLRRIVGIRPDAPPQAVVNALLQLAEGLQFGNQVQAAQALTSPVFTGPSAETMQKLSNLPYDQTANLATARAGQQVLPVGGTRS
nr:hypothetical protein [uncultured Rhodopila sp.]